MCSHIFRHTQCHIISVISGQCDIRCFLKISISYCIQFRTGKAQFPFWRFFLSEQVIDICDHPCIYKVIIITSGKSGFSCISVAGCNVCIHILFIFRFSSQITSCQISCPAITIIKNFLQIFIAVQYLCYITSTRWGCFLGLKAVCNFSIDCKQASKIISNITWIINSSPLCQCNCGTAACSSFSRRQYHHISLFDVLFQFFDCLCRCIFFGCFNFYICVVLHRRIRIIFRFCI